MKHQNKIKSSCHLLIPATTIFFLISNDTVAYQGYNL